jgi:hypothetical protein
VPVLEERRVPGALVESPGIELREVDDERCRGRSLATGEAPDFAGQGGITEANDVRDHHNTTVTCLDDRMGPPVVRIVNSDDHQLVPERVEPGDENELVPAPTAQGTAGSLCL